MGKLTISMAMFKFANCSSLPEGSLSTSWCPLGGWLVDKKPGGNMGVEHPWFPKQSQHVGFVLSLFRNQTKTHSMWTAICRGVITGNLWLVVVFHFFGGEYWPIQFVQIVQRSQPGMGRNQSQRVLCCKWKITGQPWPDIFLLWTSRDWPLVWYFSFWFGNPQDMIVDRCGCVYSRIVYSPNKVLSTNGAGATFGRCCPSLVDIAVACVAHCQKRIEKGQLAALNHWSVFSKHVLHTSEYVWKWGIPPMK